MAAIKLFISVLYLYETCTCTRCFVNEKLSVLFLAPACDVIRRQDALYKNVESNIEYVRSVRRLFESIFRMRHCGGMVMPSCFVCMLSSLWLFSCQLGQRFYRVLWRRSKTRIASACFIKVNNIIIKHSKAKYVQKIRYNLILLIRPSNKTDLFLKTRFSSIA